MPSVLVRRFLTISEKFAHRLSFEDEIEHECKNFDYSLNSGLTLSGKVRWKHHTANCAKEAHVAEDLKFLISRKLSMEVSINRITQLSSSGELGASFTRDGYCGQLQPKERVQVQAALDMFNEIREEMEADWLRSSRLCVLEEDDYILCNQRVRPFPAAQKVFMSNHPHV